MMVTFSEAYTVEPSWDDSVISFTLDENDLVFDESLDQHTVSITICNEANTFAEGSLELVGKNEPQMDGVFFRSGETGINSTYSLASKGCQDFEIDVDTSESRWFQRKFDNPFKKRNFRTNR